MYSNKEKEGNVVFKGIKKLVEDNGVPADLNIDFWC
jgi:hypothetical protein